MFGYYNHDHIVCTDGSTLLPQATVRYTGRMHERGQRGRRGLDVFVLQGSKHHAIHRFPSAITLEASRGTRQLTCSRCLRRCLTRPSNIQFILFLSITCKWTEGGATSSNLSSQTRRSSDREFACPLHPMILAKMQGTLWYFNSVPEFLFDVYAVYSTMYHMYVFCVVRTDKWVLCISLF